MMIDFRSDHGRFLLRAVAACIHADHVLMHQKDGEGFWELPGGRCELLETSSETLRREMQEELELEVDVGGLLWVAESVFEYQGRPIHQVEFCYRVSLPGDSPLLDLQMTRRLVDGGSQFTFRWVPLADLDMVTILPSFYQRVLRQIPVSPEHIQHRGL